MKKIKSSIALNIYLLYIYYSLLLAIRNVVTILAIRRPKHTVSPTFNLLKLKNRGKTLNMILKCLYVKNIYLLVRKNNKNGANRLICISQAKNQLWWKHLIKFNKTKINFMLKNYKIELDFPTFSSVTSRLFMSNTLVHQSLRHRFFSKPSLGNKGPLPEYGLNVALIKKTRKYGGVNLNVI